MGSHRISVDIGGPFPFGGVGPTSSVVLGLQMFHLRVHMEPVIDAQVHRLPRHRRRHGLADLEAQIYSW